MRCPNCNVPFQWSEPNCVSCGVSLDGKRSKIKLLAGLAAVVAGVALLLVGG